MQLGRVPDNVDGSVPPSSGDGQSQPTNSETGADSSVSSVGDGVPLAYGMGPSTDTNASGNGEHIQLLRFEAPTDSDARWSTGTVQASAIVSLLVIAALAVLKEAFEDSARFVVMNRTFLAITFACSAALLLAFTYMIVRILLRVRQSLRLQRTWSRRRVIAVRAAAPHAAIIFAMLIIFTTGSAAFLVKPELFCFPTWPIWTAQWLGMLLWNLELLLLAIDGHNIVLLDADDHLSERLVGDLPLRRHWKKVTFIALPLAALSTYVFFYNASNGHEIEVQLLDGHCSWGAALKCEMSVEMRILGGFWGGFALVYSLLYFRYLLEAGRLLRKRLYQRFRLNHLSVQLQYRINGTFFAVWVVGALALWAFGSDQCANWAVSAWGFLPSQLCVTGVTAVRLFLSEPLLPRDGALEPQALLQQIAWTERSLPRKLAARSAALRAAAGAEGATGAPMFCMETAIKLFFWSTIAYEYTEAEGQKFSTLPEEVCALLGEVAEAMSLYALEKRHLFYDRTCETKVVVAWNSETILVCVRGSSHRANFLQDLRFVQTAHPPKRQIRGRTPRVHKGFLATWRTNAIHERVIEHVSALLDSAEDRARVRVFTCGHSLGGAVASLASYDFVTRCGISPEQITCYTFGCPRVGNHAFAADYNETVPNHWNVINDQDAVAKGMKLLGYYKRHGQRAIVNARGDLIVRPSFLEFSLLQNPFGSRVSHHMNAGYHRALFAIVTAQLTTGQRHADGVEGLLQLLQDVPVLRTAVAAHAQSRGISLRERLAPPADVAAMSDASLESATAHFTASRHWAALYAVCSEESDESAGSVELEAKAIDAPQPGDAAVTLPQPPATPSAGALATEASPGASSEGVRPGEIREPQQPSGAGIGKGAAAAAPPAAASKPARWRCPLSCRPEELPPGARLRENVLDMGAAPNMRTCSRRRGRGRRRRGCGSSRVARSSAAASVAGEAALPSAQGAS